METWTLAIIIIIVIVIIYLKNRQDIQKIETLVKSQMKQPHRQPQLQSKRQSRYKRPAVGFTMTSPAPPLPLSTMYAIRIGREVIGRGGPGDDIYDYDHGLTTGPRY